MRLWYLSYRQPAKAQPSLSICPVSPETLLFAHMKYGSRPKSRHLAPLDGCACAFEEWVYGGRKVPWSHELAHFAYFNQSCDTYLPDSAEISQVKDVMELGRSRQHLYLCLLPDLACRQYKIVDHLCHLLREASFLEWRKSWWQFLKVSLDWNVRVGQLTTFLLCFSMKCRNSSVKSKLIISLFQRMKIRLLDFHCLGLTTFFSSILWILC